MKTIKILITAMILVLAAGQAKAQNVSFYYAIEIDGVLCGYAFVESATVEYEGMQMIETQDTVFLMLKALGQEMNMEIISRHVLYPDSYEVVLNESTMDYKTGDVISSKTKVYDGFALRTESQGGNADTIVLNDNVIFDNPLSSPYLLKDFSEANAGTKTYEIYDYIRGHIAEQECELIREEEVLLAGKELHTMVFHIKNLHDGTNSKIWVNKEDGMTVKFEILNRLIYLADKSVIKRIKTVDLDNNLFGKVDVSISNFTDMTWLKVQADIQSAGEEISVESLNFPGQKFEGIVDENHIIGVFEVEPIKYDGSGAPGFPPQFELDESFQKYLEPEIFIESDHPEIIAEAKAITEGSKDSWEATVRLSKWVGKEISGAVPGGTTAINTYRIRQGECGSHSRLLTAFCRAVGIPSRLSIGCMYSTWYNGSFGQHAWTEVYMGDEIGWVAVDATILEYDFVDAGHIRLGTNASFQPKSMEILDYRIGDGSAQAVNAEVPPEDAALIGPYTNPDNRNVLEVVYADGSISVDIMGRMMLALREPNEEGKRYAVLSDAVCFSFPKNESGQVNKMVIIEKVYAMKKLDEEILIDNETPNELKKLIGPYVIFQLQATFEVICKNGALHIIVPDVEEPRFLERLGTDNWRDTVDLKEYHFVINNDESVSGMNIFVSSSLNKGSTPEWIMRKLIADKGLDEAETEFKQLWDERKLDFDQTESDLNNLGYEYLSTDQIDNALMVFKVNTEIFPESFNVYDSYGEALLKSGNTENAIINYQKSLELNPENTHAQEKLDELNAKKQ